MTDIIFPFSKDGKPCGFNSWTEQEFIFKPDKYSACIIPLANLKNNLRLMVKDKRARIVKAGRVEAVVVPKEQFNNLFI
jgi:hypothetical protein